ncbi:MAG TPA: aminotransferase class IV [Ottowia sp.]|jgi:D-alanine transaminase|nr:aminotransferase class IV [Ottowia sp.]HNE59825.1 aminotransferase class IV [Ottowia sp.]HNI85844.1 aminotransferase class IV [Ottowia sp.]HNJ45204.1 aminotransferase class IV [Ottowia sp.]HNK53410.1 aminotransferase class IV [Ottowia sp.]
MSYDPCAHLPPLPCYLNGEITNMREARISPLDRGFIFGDGIYEGIAVYGRPGHAPRPFRFAQHMARLERGLRETRIPNPHTADEWRQIALDLIAAYARQSSADATNDAQAAPQDWFFYFQVTRGVALRDHPMLPGLTPTVFATCLPMKPPTAEQRAQGVACVTADDFRWQKAHLKTISLLGAVFARQISVDAGALETVMFRDGFLSEAASSNVWVVKNGTVYGPPKDHLVLEGIRYGAIEELCRQEGIGFELRRIPRADVLAADELLLSSATKEVLPITTLDGQPVGSGRPGPVSQRLYAAYQRAKDALFAA